MYTAKEIYGYEKSKPWITEDTLKMTKVKRIAKSKDPIKYKILKHETQKRIRIDKQNDLDNLCREVEESSQKGNT